MTDRLTPTDLAARWKRPVQWVRDHAREFGGFKVGATWRFDPDDIDRYESRQKAADPLRMTDGAERRRSA